jgi:hypothetical protein
VVEAQTYHKNGQAMSSTTEGLHRHDFDIPVSQRHGFGFGHHHFGKTAMYINSIGGSSVLKSVNDP